MYVKAFDDFTQVLGESFKITGRLHYLVYLRLMLDTRFPS